MNSYHKNHPDPDIRRKYAEWEKAYYASNATSGGHGSAEAEREVQKKKKAARLSVRQLLQTLGGQSVKGGNGGTKIPQNLNKARRAMMRRSGAQRGS